MATDIQYLIHGETGERRILIRPNARQEIHLSASTDNTEILEQMLFLLTNPYPPPDGDQITNLQEIADSLLQLNSTESSKHPISQSTLKRLKTQPVSSLETTETTCSICQMDYGDKDRCIQLPCGHHFHPNCIMTWFSENDTCPLCRERVYLPPDRATAATVITRNMRLYTMKQGLRRARDERLRPYHCHATTIQRVYQGYRIRLYLRKLKELQIRPNDLQNMDRLPPIYECCACNYPVLASNNVRSSYRWQLHLQHYLQLCPYCFGDV